MNLKSLGLIFSAAIFILILFLANNYLLIILALLGVLLVLLVFALKPEVGLYVLALSVPLINWNFNWNNLSVFFVELVALGLLISFIIRQIYLVIFKKDKNSLKKIKFPLWQPFLLFMIACALSSLNSRYVFYSSWYSIRWVLFFYLAYLFVPYNIINNIKSLKRIVIALIFSGSLVALMGLFSLLGQDWYNDFFRIQPTSFLGIYPIGYNHNLIAEFLVIITFLVLSLKYWFKSERANRLINILFIIFFAITVGTFSRTAWIVLALEIVLFLYLDTLYLKRKKWDFKKIIVAIVISLVVLVPFIIRMDPLAI